MTRMRINLIPKPPKPATMERLRNKVMGGYVLLVYHLNERVSRDKKLIEMYEKYFDFMERRYPV